MATDAEQHDYVGEFRYVFYTAVDQYEPTISFYRDVLALPVTGGFSHGTYFQASTGVIEVIQDAVVLVSPLMASAASLLGDVVELEFINYGTDGSGPSPPPFDPNCLTLLTVLLRADSTALACSYIAATIAALASAVSSSRIYTGQTSRP